MNRLLVQLFDNRLSVFLLFLFSLVSFNFWPNWADKLSYQLTDIQISVLHKLGYHHEIDPRVVVLDVDDKSIDAYGRWPWRRSLTATLFRQLETASIVVADIVFSEESEPAEDRILADALDNNDNVILGFFLRGQASSGGGEDAFRHIESCALQRVQRLSSYVDLPAVESAEVNIPLIADSALSCALFTVTSDSDGIYRHYPLLYVYQDLVLPTLALQAFQFETNEELQVALDHKGIQSIKGKNLRIEGQNQLFINFPREIPAVSAGDVLSGKVTADFFEDKIVLIGLSEIGLYDIRPTNLDPYTPGVHIHAAALSNMLKSNWYSHNPVLSLLLTLASILMLTNMARAIRGNRSRWAFYLVYFAVVIVAATINLYLSNGAILLFEFLFYSVLCLLLIEGKNFLVIHNRYQSVKSAFSSYVVPEVVETIVEQGISAEQPGVLKPVTVMFSDIQNFTNMTENLPPEQVIALLNTVFTPVTEHIINNQGMLDKYIGDEVMAVFNAPIDIEHYHDKSITAAIGIQSSIQDINETLKNQGLPAIALSLGIASGPVTLGNMGTALRLNYTAIGNTVNLAARMTSLSKVYGQDILITKEVYDELSQVHQALFRFIDRVIVKGKSSTTEIYGVQSVFVEPNEYLHLAYLRGFELYAQGQFKDASEALLDLYEQYNDNASLCLYKRCLHLVESPPKNWNGVFKFGHK